MRQVKQCGVTSSTVSSHQRIGKNQPLARFVYNNANNICFEKDRWLPAPLSMDLAMRSISKQEKRVKLFDKTARQEISETISSIVKSASSLSFKGT